MQDVEWEAVFELLRLLREALQCRTLTLSAMPDLSPFLPPLCSLAEGHSSRLELFNHKPDTTEVASSVYPLLATLATYPGHLDRRAQVSVCVNVCVCMCTCMYVCACACVHGRLSPLAVTSMIWCAVWRQGWWERRQVLAPQLSLCAPWSFRPL